MPRQSILALGLLVFALALGLSASWSPAAEPQAAHWGLRRRSLMVFIQLERVSRFGFQG